MAQRDTTESDYYRDNQRRLILKNLQTLQGNVKKAIADGAVSLASDYELEYHLLVRRAWIWWRTGMTDQLFISQAHVLKQKKNDIDHLRWLDGAVQGVLTVIADQSPELYQAALPRKEPMRSGRSTQPVRVFISSIVDGYEDRRDAARDAISDLNQDENYNFQIVRAEDLPASGEKSPEETCLDAVRGCHVYLGIYGGKYGYVNPRLGISATEQEYDAARKGAKDILIFVERTEKCDERQDVFLRKVGDYQKGQFWKEVTDVHQLKYEVARALRTAMGPVKRTSTDQDERDRPRFACQSLGFSNFADGFEPVFKVSHWEGERIPNIAWRFRGPRFRTEWKQASCLSLDRTKFSSRFDLSKNPTADDLVKSDELGLEIRYYWRGQWRRELHRWHVTVKSSSGKSGCDVNDPIPETLYFDDEADEVG